MGKNVATLAILTILVGSYMHTLSLVFELSLSLLCEFFAASLLGLVLLPEALFSDAVAVVVVASVQMVPASSSVAVATPTVVVVILSLGAAPLKKTTQSSCSMSS